MPAARLISVFAAVGAALRQFKFEHWILYEKVLKG